MTKNTNCLRVVSISYLFDKGKHLALEGLPLTTKLKCRGKECRGGACGTPFCISISDRIETCSWLIPTSGHTSVSSQSMQGDTWHQGRVGVLVARSTHLN